MVGGGHNGLTAAAYLARAGNSVLVLERRERLGGACTLERPFADPRYEVSPCAYVVGLLDELVIRELDLKRRGLHVDVADPNLWVPFADGTSFGQWLDDDRTNADLQALKVSAKDIEGYWAYEHLFDEIRRRLRTGERDTWVGESPSRAELEELLHGEQTMIDVVFEASIAEVLDDHMSDQRLKDALFGQGVIGAWAGPKDKGTASIKLMHYQGDLEGQGPVWGYVRGGMGMVSLRDRRRRAGGRRDARRRRPGRRDPPRGGRPPRGRHADRGPHRDQQRRPEADARDARRPAGRLQGPHRRAGRSAARSSSSTPRSPACPPGPRRRARTSRPAPPSTSPPGSTPPRRPSTAARGARPPSASARSTCRRATTRRPRPPGRHLMSVFGQYAPYDFDWATRRDEVARQFIDLIATFAPDFPDVLEHYEVLGPPDIEARIGLTGGNIFQGETMPDQMWEHRLSSRTPVAGLYLCGAATHPAGSVIALNGRNAAMAVLEDAQARPSSHSRIER